MKTDLVKSQANLVRIRVWNRVSISEFLTTAKTMAKQGLFKGEKKEQPVPRIGHVSLETFGDDGVYASFWPIAADDGEADPAQKFKRGVKGGLADSPEEDVKNEDGAMPDIVVDLYSLDVQKINEEFNKFKDSGANWSIWGSAEFFRDKNTRNCSGLVAYLLNVGGINKLVSSHSQTYSKAGSYFGSAVGVVNSSSIIGPALSNLSGAPAVNIRVLTAMAATKPPIGGTTLYIAGTAIQGAVPVIVAGIITSIVIMGVCTFAGKFLGSAVDNVEGNGLVITPGGVGTLAKFAKAAEEEKYELVLPNRTKVTPSPAPVLRMT